MGLGKLPKALKKNPRVFDDVDGLMNVPDSVKNLPASGVKVNIGDGFAEGARGIRKATSKSKTLRGIGRKEGQQLTKRAKKPGTRLRI